MEEEIQDESEFLKEAAMIKTIDFITNVSATIKKSKVKKQIHNEYVKICCIIKLWIG